MKYIIYTLFIFFIGQTSLIAHTIKLNEYNNSNTVNTEVLNRRAIVRVCRNYDTITSTKSLKSEFHKNTSKDSILEKFKLKIEKIKLEEDFDQLLETLKQHPSQFEFIDKSSYENLVNTQRKKIKDSMTIKEFYQITSPIVASLGCLHTRIVNTSFFRTPFKYWLPIIVWFENDKMYAINNCVENLEMNLGSEILEINGVSADDIYNTLKTTISADAFNKNFYVGDLNVNFLYYYHSYYGFSDTYNIKFKPYNSKNEVETTYDIYEPEPRYKVKIEQKPRFNLDIQKTHNTAIIRIKNFNYFPRGRQNVEYFKKTLDDYIHKINQQNIEKIAFDLRGNRGGNPACTAYLISYLTSKKISFYVDNEINNTRNRSIVVEPKTNNLSRKKTYILINGRCASATAEMLAVIKHNKLAVIVGQETGGTYSTFPGRGVKPLVNTGLAVQVGTERESMDVPKLPLNKGISPDIYIQETFKDIIREKDLLLDYIYKIH